MGGNKAALVARIEAIPLHLDENDLVQAGEGDRSSNVSPEWGAAFAPPAPGSIVGMSFRDSSEVQYKVQGDRRQLQHQVARVGGVVLHRRRARSRV